MAQVDSRWVAVGNGAGRAIAWTSSDCTAWRPIPAESGLDGTTVNRIVAVGSPFVALGESTSGDGAAWQSFDGTALTRLQTGDTT